jgi:hypothetical protein
MLAGMKGNLLPRLGITTHEYSLSDRLSEARTQFVDKLAYKKDAVLPLVLPDGRSP